VAGSICLLPAVQARQAAPQKEGGRAASGVSAEQGSAGQASPGQTNPGAQSGGTSAPQETPGQPKSAEGAKSGQDLPKNPPDQPATSHERLFGALPNFLTVDSNSPLPPLSPGQKFKLVARGMFDPAEFVWVGVIAGLGQASDSEPSYGQGAAGYGLRYGTTYGDTLIENFMVGAILPSLLRQDPRYYRLGKGGFLRRTEYAIGRIFVTRSDSGHRQFNYSQILGSAIAAGISTYSYHPEGDRKLGNACSVWGTQLASDAIATFLKEFWPDLRRKARKKSSTPG